MTLPRYSREILAVLESEGQLSGKDLRHTLNTGKRFWERWSGASFYGKMADLEDQGLVSREVITSHAGPHEFHLHHFEITDKGRKALAVLV